MTAVSIRPFTEALNRRHEKLTELSSTGRKILGYFCTYTPIELVHAAGFIPTRIMGGTDSITSADSLTPHFICSYIRRAVESAIAGQYDYLAGMVQGYTCDVACGVMNVWEENFKGEVFHTVPMPYQDTPEARQFFTLALGELVTKLNDHGGTFTEEALDKSLALYKEIRNHTLELYKLRYKGALPLSAGDFLSVVQAGFVTPPEDYLDLLTQLAEQIQNVESPKRTGPRILVSGSIIEDRAILEQLESSGGIVVADDLCSGMRNFQPATGQRSDPMERLVDRYMKRFPCPARSRADDRTSLMLELIAKSGAQGVVFLFQKFCTPHLADHPTISRQLKDHGIPSVAIEIEETGVSPGQLKTRIEAFYEMLES